MRFSQLPLITAAIFCQQTVATAGPAPALAKEPISPPPLQEADAWKFTLGMPGWLAGLEGDVGVMGFQPIHSEVPFSKILDHLDMVASLSFEAQKGPWSFYAEGLYMKVSAGGQTPGPLLDTLNVDLRQVMAEAQIGYRLWESDRGYFDLIAGARYSSMDVGMELDIDSEGVRDLSEHLAQEVVHRVTNSVRVKADAALAEAKSAIIDALATAKTNVSNKALEVQAGSREKIVEVGKSRIQGRVDNILENYPRLPEIIERSGPVADAMRELIAAKVAEKKADIDDAQAALSQRIQSANAAVSAQAAAARAALNEKVRATKASVRNRLAKAVRNAEEKLARKIESEIHNTIPSHLSGSKSWVDPIVGFRARYNFTDHFYAAAKADIGGFGIGSDLTWQLFGAVGYQFNQHWSSELGYKYLSVDYSNNGFVYDMAMGGVFIGLKYTF